MTERERLLIEKNGVQEDFYGQLVNQLIREKYSQSQVEAILNNYLNEPENEKYKQEFIALQSFRTECKEVAKIQFYGSN